MLSVKQSLSIIVKSLFASCALVMALSACTASVQTRPYYQQGYYVNGHYDRMGYWHPGHWNN